ncbi:divalent cation transporter [Massilia sp. WF1]|uniref:ZIP family metal transporter n=1 Tax=unclassified Massilia TaxID=2609279 RepID=UPI00064B040C|nr:MULTISPECIES: ZIP family metal transporter [unclassified Massilia]ALK97394.1 divalent cation transporter [Massilia sp. WG5]KLU36575.1 divalent cation transporter [Massilia sp. WF1]
MHTQVARALRPRKALGFLICGVGAVLLFSNLLRQLIEATPKLGAALVGGGTAAAATALGTLPVLLSQKFSKRTYDCFLGFGAGVMLGATAFSLVIPALAAARAGGAGNWGASLGVGGGVMLGTGLLLALDRLISTDGILQPADPRDGRSPGSASIRRAWLFVWAVALHNLPEGLAIGVAYGGVDPGKAHSLATGIAIQDVPEGLVVALALRTVGYGRGLSTALGVASGLIEPVAAALGVALIGVAAGLLPFALAAAAGAMLFVIANEVVPESHQHGNGTWASVSLIFGFVLMTVLDTALG